MISNVSNNLNNLSNLDNRKASSLTSKINHFAKNKAYYAKKGEPIYQKDMDSDEDGVVSFDEFKEYCKTHDADIEQLLKNWLIYHATKDTAETEKEIKEKAEEEKTKENREDGGITYAKKGDAKYEAVMDSNDDGKITYKEYLEYCKNNAKEEKNSSKTTVEDSDNEFKITDSKKATSEYTKSAPPEGKIETEG